MVNSDKFHMAQIRMVHIIIYIKDILVLDMFSKVDLRNNTLHYTKHIDRYKNSISKYEASSHIKTPSTHPQTGENSSKWLLLTIVPGLAVLGACTLLLTWTLCSKHHAIQARAIELDVLRCSDESEEE